MKMNVSMFSFLENINIQIPTLFNNYSLTGTQG